MLLKNVKSAYFVTFVLLGFVLIGGMFSAIYLDLSNLEKSIFLLISSIQFFLVIVLLLYIIIAKSQQKLLLRRSFYHYIDETIAEASIGVLIYDENAIIIWSSSFLKNNGFDKFIGIDIYTLLEEFSVDVSSSTKKNIQFNGQIYEMDFKSANNSVLIKEITSDVNLTQNYENGRIAFGELEIDNYAQFQASLGEETAFKIQQAVITMLDSVSRDYQMFYRQYSNGKFLLITNNDSLNKMKNVRFSFLQKLLEESEHKLKAKISFSLGFATGTTIFKELVANCQESLKQAQLRGGDQVVVHNYNEKPEYFGATKEMSPSKSRVKIKAFAKMFFEHAKSNQISNIIIQGHINTDLDSIGASLGLRGMIKATVNKDVRIANVKWDSTAERALKKFYTQKELDEIFIPLKESKKIVDKNTLMVVVDTSNKQLIEQIELFNNIRPQNVYIFDHHRTGKIEIPHIEKNLYIDTVASSACEIITELISYMFIRETSFGREAQMLLCGIYLDTNQFLKTTSSRTFEAAAYLENCGASPSVAVDILKMLDVENTQISRILSNLYEIKPGFYLSITDAIVNDLVVSKAADEALRVVGRKASFIVARVSGDVIEYKLSARSSGVNIQRIVESIGGGGHYAAAAARSREPLKKFEHRIIEAIKADKDEGNSN